MTLSEASQLFLRHYSSAVNLSPHTLRAYGCDLEDAQRFLGAFKRLDAVEREQLRGYIQYMRVDKQLKETTIKRRLASLKLLFKWALAEKLLKLNPFDALNERIRLPKRLPRALDRDDQTALKRAVLNAVSAGEFTEVRDKTAVQLLLATGIRVGELVAIDLKDLSLANGCILIHGKGNRQRFVYLTQPSLVREVELYLRRRSSLLTCSEKLFVSGDGSDISTSVIRAALRRITERAGISRHVTPHMLRHTCATQWLEGGLDIRYVQKLLGHHSISTTEIYTHVSDQGLREALARAAGR